MTKAVLNTKINLPLFIVCLFSPLLLAECVTLSSPNPYIVLQNLFLPVFMPPVWLLILVWLFLYLIMGCSLYILLTNDLIHGRAKNSSVIYFFLQLALNYLWFTIFFAFQYRGFSVLIMAFLLALVIAVWKRLRAVNAFISRLWGLYTAWLFFIAILNYSIWIINL